MILLNLYTFTYIFPLDFPGMLAPIFSRDSFRPPSLSDRRYYHLPPLKRSPNDSPWWSYTMAQSVTWFFFYPLNESQRGLLCHVFFSWGGGSDSYTEVPNIHSNPINHLRSDSLWVPKKPGNSWPRWYGDHFFIQNRVPCLSAIQGRGNYAKRISSHVISHVSA